MNQDLEQIKILSIFHYVVAGIAALFACFPIFHLIAGISMLAGNSSPDNSTTNMPFPFNMFGLIFTVIPAVMILFGWALPLAWQFQATCFQKKRNYMFCMIMAGIGCIFMPFGTVLGVFTIIVLSRLSVKDLFSNAVAAAQP